MRPSSSSARPFHSVTYLFTQIPSKTSSCFFSALTGGVRRRTFHRGCVLGCAFSTFSVSSPFALRLVTDGSVSNVTILNHYSGRLLGFLGGRFRCIICSNLGGLSTGCSRVVYSKARVDCSIMAHLVRRNREGVTCVNRARGRGQCIKCYSTLASTSVSIDPGCISGVIRSARRKCGNIYRLLGDNYSTATFFYTSSVATVNTVGTVGRCNLHVPRSMSITDVSSVSATRCLVPSLAATRVPLSRVKGVTTGVLVSHVRNNRRGRLGVLFPCSVVRHGDATTFHGVRNGPRGWFTCDGPHGWYVLVRLVLR